MKTGIALVRQRVEEIDGVSATWFEWNLKIDGHEKTLVIEVDFNTDPNSSDCRPSVLDAIHNTVIGVLTEETTMVVSGIKVVPKGIR